MAKYKVYIYQHNADTFIDDQYFLVATTFVNARDVVDLTKKMNILNKVFDYAFDPLYYTDCYLGDIFRMMAYRVETNQNKLKFHSDEFI